MKKINLILLLVSIIVLTSHNNKLETADAIYFGGTILTMEGEKPFYEEAVADKDGKIVFVGKLKDAKKMIGANTVTIDLKGKTMLPGFIDNHLHQPLGAFLLSMPWILAEEWVLPDRHITPTIGKEEYISKMIGLEKDLLTPNEWLNVWGYASYYHGKITRSDLDKISSTRPISIWHRSFHETILNTKALEILKLNEHNTKHPQINFIEGHFKEAGLQEILLFKIFPVIMKNEQYKEGMLKVTQLLQSSGITSCFDPAGVLGYTADQIKIARDVLDRIDVPYKSYLCKDARLTVPNFDGPKWVDVIKNSDKQNGKNLIYLNTEAKTFCDGAFFSQLMQVNGNYADGHHGEWIYAPEVLDKASTAYYEAGISNHIHVNGDQGVDSILAIYNRITKNGVLKDARVVLHHFGLSNPDQITKIKKLGIMVSVNPNYVNALGEIYGTLGMDTARSNNFSRSGTLFKNGVVTALHSDFPMAPAQPLYLAWVAVNRFGISGKVLGANEKISIWNALKAITINGAIEYGKENEIGSIKVGKNADFVILEKNPLKVNPIKLKDIKVISTVFEGKFFKGKQSTIVY